MTMSSFSFDKTEPRAIEIEDYLPNLFKKYSCQALVQARSNPNQKGEGPSLD